MSVATSVGATYYIELECQAEPNISAGFLMGRLMHSLHIGLVNTTPPGERCPIGVTFPEYRLPEKSSASFNAASPPIGSRLRLFAQDEATLDGFPWRRVLRGLDDYVYRTTVRETGSNSQYAAFARRQHNRSIGRLVRRAMKRKGLSESEAMALYADHEPGECRLPYVDMRSESSGERFRLFVERLEVPPSHKWGFSSYGLSRSVPLPAF